MVNKKKENLEIGKQMEEYKHNSSNLVLSPVSTLTAGIDSKIIKLVYLQNLKVRAIILILMVVFNTKLLERLHYLQVQVFTLFMTLEEYFT